MQITKIWQKDSCYTTTKQTLDYPKVNINPTWEGGLHTVKFNYLGMKRPRNKTETKQGQEVPRINLNLQTKAAHHLVQQGQAKEGGAGKATKTSIGSF